MNILLCISVKSNLSGRQYEVGNWQYAVGNFF